MSSKAYFQQVANQWDEMRKNFFTEAVREKAYELAGVSADKSAADIGAGTGFVTEGLLARGLKVIAVDESDEMLATMEKRFAGSSNIKYALGESKALPISDSSVDYAFANMYLHHVENPCAAIMEMARIVKPGGRVILTDLDTHNHDFLKTEHHDRWMGFNREDIRQWFANARLINISVECVNQSCCAESSCGEKAAIGIFAAVGQKSE